MIPDSLAEAYALPTLFREGVVKRAQPSSVVRGRYVGSRVRTDVGSGIALTGTFLL
jgi:hypothetical protein